MPSTKRALLISGLVAASLVAAFALMLPPKASPLPPESPAENPDEMPDVSGRLIAPSPGLSLYTNAEQGFLLSYPAEIIPMDDPKTMAASGYIPTCDPDTAIVCFPYGKEKYAGTNFEGSAFVIHERQDLTTDKACMAAQMGERDQANTTINGIDFQTFSFGDAAMSHRLEGRNYRVVHDNRCLELSTRLATTVFEVWEPGSIREFTEADRTEVQSVLEGMLQSFRFQEHLELL